VLVTLACSMLTPTIALAGAPARVKGRRPGLTFGDRRPSGATHTSSPASAPTASSVKPSEASGNTGTDFWLACPLPPRRDGAVSVLLAGNSDAKGTVSVIGGDDRESFSVSQGEPTSVEIPVGKGQGEVVAAIHVEASSPVSALLLDREGGARTYAGLSTIALGTEYIATGNTPAYGGGVSRLVVLATSDSTTVTINPSLAADTHQAGESYSVTLNQGAVYQFDNAAQPGGDLTGTVVSSDKPVAVFESHEAARVSTQDGEPDEGWFAQLPPTELWGRSFVASPAGERGGLVRVVASTDGTHVNIDGSDVATLDRGRAYEQAVGGPSLVTSDKPVLVSTYANVITPSGLIPSSPLVLVTPTERYLNTYSFATPAGGFDRHHMNIVVPGGAFAGVTLDGTPVSASGYVTVGDGRFSVASIEVKGGTHTLIGETPFGVTAYGAGGVSRYGYSAGVGLAAPGTKETGVHAGNSLKANIPTMPASSGCGDLVAVVRHAPTVNGSVQGSVQMLTGEWVNLNSGNVITSDLLVPGTPSVQINGTPNYQGTVDGTGSAQPTGYGVTINSGAQLRHLVRRTDPVTLANVPVPPASTGTRSVTINTPGQSAGDWATVRDLTLNAGVGSVTVPAGTYNNFTANDHSYLVFGVAGATQASVYNLDTLTLNSNSGLQLLGPVVINVGSRVAVNSGVTMGSSQNPRWLSLNVARYEVTVNSGGTLYGVVNDPNGTVNVNGRLVGSTASDRLSLNSGASLEWMGCPAPTNQPPTVSAGANQTITLPNGASLNGTVSDDGLPAGSSVSATWGKVSGPGTVTFADPHSAATTATFSAPGTYVLKLSASDTELTGEGDVTVNVVSATNQPPVVSAGADQSITLPANTVSLNGSASDDGLPLGGQFSTRWSVVSTRPALPPGFLGDDFDDNSFDTTRWQNFQIDTFGAQLIERNERLEFQTGPQGGGGFFRSNGYVDAREHAVTFKLGGYSPSSGQTFRFRVRDDGAATTYWVDIGYGTMNFYADSFFDSVSRGDAANIPYDGTSPVWIRWRESGQLYSWDTSTDGVNWTPRVETTFYRPATTAQYFRFDYGSQPGGPVIYIDDFAMISPAWAAVAGPGTVTFADPTSPATTATFSDAGIYTLRLTASDTEFERTSDVTVKVAPANHPPVVNAGESQTVLIGDGAKLYGVVSDEGLPVGAPVTAAWSEVSGPGQVTFADANSPRTTAAFSTVGYYVLRLTASDTQLSGSADLLVKVVGSYEGQPGGVFVTGHDADDHSQGLYQPALGAQHVVQRAIQYVTYNKANPRILLVTDLRDPGGDNSDPRQGMRVSGYNTFDVADYGSGTPGVFDLHAVNFSNYDVVVVASDFGCWLRQDELDVLNARSAELIEYVNEGGGLVAFAESGGRPVPPGNYTGTTHDRFRFVPFVVSSEDFQQSETGTRVTPDGAATGLTDADVNGNFSHNIFTTAGGMTVIDRDSQNQILSLAVRGKHITPDGIGNDAPVVSAGASRAVTLPNGVALSGVASDDGLPAGSSLAILWRKISGPGTVTFDSPNRVSTQAFFDAPGTYDLRLSASDGQLSSYSDVTVTVNPAGQYVVVNAGADQTVRLPKQASLQAAVTDGRPNTSQPLALSWSKAGGPGDVTFTSPNALATTVSFSAPGVYVLRFTASDSRYSGSDDLTVNVRPLAQTFGDDFDDNTNDPTKWAYGPGVGEREQQLQIDVPDSASLAEFVSTAPVDMSADGAYVQFEIPDYADPSFSNNRIIYWRMQASEGNWFQWIYKYGSLEFYQNNQFLYRNPYGLHPRFWRMVHHTTPIDYVTYETSDDGANWTYWVGASQVPLDHLTFRLIVGSQGSGAAGTVKIDNVTSNVPYNAANQPPTPVAGGPYRATVGVALQLDGSRSTDPGDIITAYAWDFGDGTTGTGPTPTHTYNSVGTYTVRLTVTDPDGATGTTTTTATVTPPNQPPVVNAGADQTITLPSNATLGGSVSDDGLPAGGSLTTQWSVVTGPGAVTFADASSPATTASFGAAGVYVLRLSASDSDLTSTADVTVTVNAASPNQAPVVSAGVDQTVTPGLNLVRNGGGEEPVVAGAIPGWTKAEGDSWSPAGAGATPDALEGETYFQASGDAHAELRQDVDVSAYAASISTGAQQFAFRSAVRSGAEAQPDSCRVVFEFRDATDANVLATVDSGEIANTDTWQLVEGTFAAPAGTAWVRVRLIATRNGGATTDAYFDAVSVRAISTVGVRLNGAVTDDGLPVGGTLSATWGKVSGPGAVAFADAHAAATSATFDAPGAYVLRLSATDTELTTTSDVTINVTAPNAAPTVVAGQAQTLTLPNDTLALAGTITDDGLPQGRSVSARWKKVAGPGAVTFADAGSASTSATFAQAGNYVLRLTADDSDMSASSDLVVTVKPAPSNQPPVVSAGPNQSVSLPDAATLRGSATDDGLPSGSSLTYSWSEVSGPGAVTFSAPASPTTNASFAVEGVYVLRLSASDSQLVGHADVTVTVNAAGTNNAPVVSAGPDTEVRLPDSATLNGNATDDGKPSGGALTVAWSIVTGPGAVTFSNPTSARTQASFASSGTYVLRLTASDTELSSSDDVTVTVFDPVSGPAPAVAIASPADGEEVTAPKQVTGTVSGGAWRLEYALVEDETAPVQQWHAFSSGSGAVTDGNLGTFDPTVLLNGTYSLRLVATDTAGQTSATVIGVVVARQMKVGNFTVSFGDLSVPVAGIPIQVTRTYDSRDKRVGDFGVGWTLSVSSARVQKTVPVGSNWYETESFASIRTYCLQSTRPQLVTVTFGDGKVYKFQAVPAQQCQRFQPFSTVQMTFVPVQGTRGTLTALNGGAVSVAGSVPGPVDLVDIKDPSGYYLNPTRFRLTTEDGTSFVLNQKSGVESVSVPSGETLTLDSSGVHHSNGQSVTFARDEQGRISGITDPSGHTLTYTYDPNGDLQSFRDAEGNTSNFTYADDHYLTEIEVVSSDGQHRFKSATNTYENGRLTGQTDADGLEVKFGHDIDNRRETVTDKLGNTTVYEYDARGNVVYVKDAEGAETRRTYDDRDNVLTETNAQGTTTYQYDDNGYLKQVTDRLGNVTGVSMNALGQLTSVTDPRGNTSTVAYDERTGNMLKVVDTLGNETRFDYQPLGSLRTAATRVSKDDPTHPLVTSYGYDGLNRLTSETDPAGNTTTYTYDANNNRKSMTVTRSVPGHEPESLTVNYDYDGANRLVKTTYPDGTSTQVTYNELGKRATSKDQLGRETKYEYDALGQLVSTTYPDGRQEQAKYDAAGRVVQTTDRAGRVTAFGYDKVGRQTETDFADGGRTTRLFDSVGRIIETDRWLSGTESSATKYRYDSDGKDKVVYVTDALGHVTKQTYDEDGRLSKVTDANNHTTTFEYDANNRQTKVTYADGTFSSTSYDGFGRVSAKTDQAGKTTRFEYDPLGRLLKVTDALGHETRYGYDEIGELTSQTDANSHTTTFEYDQLGRRTKRTLPEGMSEIYSYDTVGDLKARTDFNGKTTAYEYDDLNRLLRKTPDASLNEPAVSFTYTATGRRETMTDATGLTTYTYDSLDRLLSKQTPEGTLTYTYDKLGDLKTVRSSNQNGVSVDYGYDALSRLASVTDNRTAAGVTKYAYDDVGNLSSVENPNGVKTAYTYNALNRLTAVTGTSAATTVASFTYELGAAGNRLSETTLGGRRVTYTYDDLYRLVGEAVTGDAGGANGTVSYAYDAVGNRLTRASTLFGVSDQSLSYDKNDRLTSDTYDADGNTRVSQGSAYSYDSESRLVSVNNGAIRYAYDGDGNRVSKTVGGVTTTYLVDTNSLTGYAQVVEELRGGQVIRQYTYGTSLISERQQINNQWGVSYYGTDGHGSVRYLTDSAGVVTDTYTYDSFGDLVSFTGSTPNEYLFAGERIDPETGMYYLRARYMQPATGRFFTQDSYEGSPFDPQSLHKYTFTSNDPVNNIDPTGHDGLGDLAAAFTVNSVLAGIIFIAASGVIQGVRNKLKGGSFTEGFYEGVYQALPIALLIVLVPEAIPILMGLGLVISIPTIYNDLHEEHYALAAFDTLLTVLGGVGFLRQVFPPEVATTIFEEPYVPSGGTNAASSEELQNVRITIARQIHQIELGTDPAKGDQYNPIEGEIGMWLESQLGRRLGRDPSGDYDWFVTVNGKTYDAVGPVPSQHFDIGSFSTQIIEHLEFKQGLDFVLVDLRGLTPSQAAQVDNFLSTLTQAQLGRIIIRR
jgi:RHS repeat-associated protein